MEEQTIGQRIAAKRKELAMSQIDLGEEMGVSRQSVSKWEADAAIPEIDTLIALSKLFGVSVGWLLGVEEEAKPEEAADAEFTDREWELIDRLTQPQPKTPKWLLPLTAGAAAVSLCAAIVAGAALSSARSSRADLAVISQAVSNLTTSTGALIPDTDVLESYQFLLTPSDDLSGCTFEFFGYPASYEKDSEAELLVVLGGEEACREKCSWNGTCYTATFTLPARSGYSAYLSLTNKSGIVRSTMLVEPLLSGLLDKTKFGKVSLEFQDYDYDGSSLNLRELQFFIDIPAVFRDTPDLWSRCDLVVLADGQELGRLDILNRSKYSKQVNFSGGDADFYSQAQSIAIGDISGCSQIELMLDCGFTTGLQMQKVLHTWTVQNGSI